MTFPIFRPKTLKKLLDYAMIGYIFCVPISTTATDLFALILVLLWLLGGNFKQRFREIAANKPALAVLAWIALHVIGLLWSADLANGLYIAKRQWKILLFPVLLTMVDRKQAHCYMTTFIAAMLFSSGTTWLSSQPFMQGDLLFNGPIIFQSRIVQTPLLALTLYLLGRRLITSPATGPTRTITLAIIGLTTWTAFS